MPAGWHTTPRYCGTYHVSRAEKALFMLRMLRMLLRLLRMLLIVPLLGFLMLLLLLGMRLLLLLPMLLLLLLLLGMLLLLLLLLGMRLLLLLPMLLLLLLSMLLLPMLLLLLLSMLLLPMLLLLLLSMLLLLLLLLGMLLAFRMAGSWLSRASGPCARQSRSPRPKGDRTMRHTVTMWVVCWRSRTSAQQGHGAPIAKGVAEDWATESNRKFPTIEHWIVPAIEMMMR